MCGGDRQNVSPAVGEIDAKNRCAFIRNSVLALELKNMLRIGDLHRCCGVGSLCGLWSYERLAPLVVGCRLFS